MTKRDLALAAVAAIAVLALVLIGRSDIEQSGEIITGIVGLGSMALGRISGANGERV